MHYRAKLVIFAEITIIAAHISSFLTKKRAFKTILDEFFYDDHLNAELLLFKRMIFL